MAFTRTQIADLRLQATALAKSLDELMLQSVAQAQRIQQSPEAQNHVRHGAGRRLGILRGAVNRVFQIFPPARRRPLPRERLVEAEINLHAYTINVLGIFDNWAWAYLLRHGLAQSVGRLNISLFKQETQSLLPAALRAYLTSPPVSTWHQEYAKGYRDALAHRIPLYIPPAVWTPADRALHDELEAEELRCIHANEWDRLDEVRARRDRIGKPCFQFLHTFSDSPKDRPLQLHAQMICDGLTVVDVGKRFYDCWHEVGA